jgi:hypothetical protein
MNTSSEPNIEPLNNQSAEHRVSRANTANTWKKSPVLLSWFIGIQPTGTLQKGSDKLHR